MSDVINIVKYKEAKSMHKNREAIMTFQKQSPFKAGGELLWRARRLNEFRKLIAVELMDMQSEIEQIFKIASKNQNSDGGAA